MLNQDIQLVLAELRSLNQRLDRLEQLVGGSGRRGIDVSAVYTVQEASGLVRLHIETVRLKLRQGIIKGSRRAGDWRVRGAELMKLA